jgi:hypothetical protein
MKCPTAALLLAVSLSALSVGAADKDLYGDYVSTILDDKCTSCHGDVKQKGKLRLDSYAAILKGGEDGAVVKPGQPQKSRLYQALVLPLHNEDHMPPAKKDQATKAEIATIRWWIEKGAPESMTLAAAGTIPAEARPVFDGTDTNAPAPVVEAPSGEGGKKGEGRKNGRHHKEEDEDDDH